ncbi:toll-like receptor 1 [Pholidichthys leucotaenia]
MKLITAVLWAVAMLVGPQKSVSTPVSVDLSSKNLTSVPTNLPKETEILDLSCNNISHLHKGDFQSTSDLKFLNVSWNNLEEIDPETFPDTPFLQVLDLSHNGLKNLSGQEYLLHTGNLSVLNLSFNQFLTMTLGREFSSLVKLMRFTVGAKNISVGDFKSIAKVKLHTLTLSLEEDFSYEPGSLEDLHAEKLQIVFQRKEKPKLDLVADALSAFAEVEMMNLANGYQDLSKQLSERGKIFSSHLYLTNIEIHWKDLTDYVNEVLRTTISLLMISDVALYNPPYSETEVTKTSKVQTFEIRRAEVKSFFFSQEAVYNYFINMPVKNLSLVETPIIHMTCPKFQTLLQQLDFSDCALSDSIFSRMEDEKTVECETLGNLRNLNLAGNNLKKLQLLSKRMQYMKSLQHLDLSTNSLEYDGMQECVWPSNIININLSSNSLTERVFNCLPNWTETVDLQNNQISAVPQSILELQRLSSLNLNSNRLRDLPACNAFPELSTLLLKSNSLHVVSVKKLEKCFKLTTLDASLNPFTCTCALRRFRRLGFESEDKSSHTHIQLVNWPDDYKCTYPEELRNCTLKEIQIPEVSCNTGLLAATILIPAVLTVITVLLLCHYLDAPWYLGMIWQWIRAKHRARMQHIDPEDLIGIEFHAFVSYSQHDADWVQNSLLPNLEGPAGGLRICHHEKDFVPGKTIIENIINCVEKSRRAVFVLSAHFVKSDWCHYELYFATHQRLSRGSDSIVLVLLEPLPQYLIPSKYYQLKSMMKRHTYLEWPQEKAKHRMFWANLRAALQANLPQA